MDIESYFSCANKIITDIKEEEFIEDQYKMYLSILPLMIRKEIDYETFKDFSERNKPRASKEVKETNKSDEEILKEVNNINF